jgi:hypothetical protein
MARGGEIELNACAVSSGYVVSRSTDMRGRKELISVSAGSSTRRVARRAGMHDLGRIRAAAARRARAC